MDQRRSPGLLVALLACLALGCPRGPAEPATEKCSNGTDDDGDQLIDCQDPSCETAESCKLDDLAIGSCTRCGQSCRDQRSCLTQRLFDERPPPMCLAGVCRRPNQAIWVEMGFRLAFGWDTLQNRIASISVRLIRSRDVHGTTVGCDAILAAASADNSQALEQSGRFNVQSVEVYRALNSSLGDGFTLKPVVAATGDRYVVLVELWDEPVSTLSAYPQGHRLGYLCDDSAGLPELTAQDDCGADAGTCRRFSYVIPPPR